jgi:hypothetical protein
MILRLGRSYLCREARFEPTRSGTEAGLSFGRWKKMRLVDGDALDNMLAGAQAKCKRNGGNFRFGVLSTVRENIREIPTIDAIPVEWLKKQADYARLEWDYDTFEGIRIVLKAWQKEQEAR